MAENETVMGELHSAVAAAINDAHAVAKSSTNSFHKYQYASAEAIIAESREHIARHGLCLIPTFAKHADGYYVMRWRLCHSSGASIEIDTSIACEAGKGRPLDKAQAGARTTMLSYVLRDLLLLPRVEHEVDTRDDREYTPRDRKVQELPAIEYAEHKAEIRKLCGRMNDIYPKGFNFRLWYRQTFGHEFDATKEQDHVEAVSWLREKVEAEGKAA